MVVHAIDADDTNDDEWRPSSISALRLVLRVVEVTTRGAVPWATLELICHER